MPRRKSGKSKATTKRRRRKSTKKQGSDFGQSLHSDGKYIPGRALSAMSHGGPHKRRSSYGLRRHVQQPFLINPFGPPQPWLVNREPEGAASSLPPPGSRFGNSLADKYVNPSGYLATWHGSPRIVPPSWNPLLYQGNDGFREGIDNPNLSQVMR